MQVHSPTYSSTWSAVRNIFNVEGVRGLVRMVNTRKSLLAYLNRVDHDRYVALIAKLGLRK